jgi:hypothetical protein
MAYAAAGGTAVPAASAAASGLLQRIVNITLKPGTEWAVIAAEPPSMARIVIGCVLPLAALQALLSFVHMAVIGVSVPFAGNVRMPMASSLTAAVMGFVFAIIGMFVLAAIVNVWAPFFAGRRSLGEALKVAAYAAVPGWLGSFFVVLPFGTLIGLLAGLYAIYVLYLGLPIVMRSAKERAVGYTVAVILTGMLMGIVLGALGMAFGGLTHLGMPARSAAAQADQGAAITGNILGNILGTDDKGKAALGQALGNLARAGQEMQNAEASASPRPAPAPAPAEAAARAQQEAAQGGNAVTAESAANAGAAVGGLLNALGGALGGNHRVTPVDFRSLGNLLPASVNGQPRGAVEGANKQAMGVKGSSANANYGGGGAGSIDVKISDVSGVSGLIDIAGGLEQTTDSQTAAGFERDIVIGGRRVHEKFSNAGKHGELQVIVAKRFEVDVEGNGVDMATLEQALGQVDLGKLEAMKDVGAQN